MTIPKSYKVPWGMARVVGEMGHLPLSATLPSEYQPGQTSAAQLFHPTQMLSESFKGTCAILIHYPSSYFFTSHNFSPTPSQCYHQECLLHSFSQDPQLLSGSVSFSAFFCLAILPLQPFNVSDFCCLVEVAKLYRK